MASKIPFYKVLQPLLCTIKQEISKRGLATCSSCLQTQSKSSPRRSSTTRGLSKLQPGRLKQRSRTDSCMRLNLLDSRTRHKFWIAMIIKLTSQTLIKVKQRKARRMLKMILLDKKMRPRAFGRMLRTSSIHKNDKLFSKQIK